MSLESVETQSIIEDKLTGMKKIGLTGAVEFEIDDNHYCKELDCVIDMVELAFFCEERNGCVSKVYCGHLETAESEMTAGKYLAYIVDE